MPHASLKTEADLDLSQHGVHATFLDHYILNMAIDVGHLKAGKSRCVGGSPVTCQLRTIESNNALLLDLACRYLHVLRASDC